VSDILELDRDSGDIERTRSLARSHREPQRTSSDATKLVVTCPVPQATESLPDPQQSERSSFDDQAPGAQEERGSSTCANHDLDDVRAGSNPDRPINRTRRADERQVKSQSQPTATLDPGSHGSGVPVTGTCIPNQQRLATR
jgi:hypothetical protein